MKVPPVAGEKGVIPVMVQAASSSSVSTTYRNRISTTSENVTTYGVEVDVLNAPSELRDGASASVTVTTASASDVLAVYVGTGVGGALVCNGRLIVGGGGKAGEVGHSKVVVGGRPCGCGGFGCVEAYAGGVHLEQMIAHAVPEYGNDLARADAAWADEDHIHEIWQRATDYLSIVIANACTLLNPSVLLLGGGVLENLPNYRAELLRKISPLIVEPARDELQIRFGELDEAGVLGAALLAQSQPGPPSSI